MKFTKGIKNPKYRIGDEVYALKTTQSAGNFESKIISGKIERIKLTANNFILDGNEVVQFMYIFYIEGHEFLFFREQDFFPTKIKLVQSLL